MNPILNKIFDKYKQDGNVEACNKALEAAGFGLRIVPGKNEITVEELAMTRVGDTPAEANGYGMMDCGIGKPDKVKITNGKLDYAVNQVGPDGETTAKFYVNILDKRYEVKGDTLVDI